MLNLQELKEAGKAPEWMTIEGLKTLREGYLVHDETPLDMYKRVARASASHLNKPEMEAKLVDYMWKGWLCLSTPVAANMGTDRGGLPISCYTQSVPDTTLGILKKFTEAGIISKMGGGMGSYWGNVRESGAPIGSFNGKSSGVIPWLTMLDKIISGISQAGVRRGSVAAYLPIEHGDIEEFIDVRRVTGDTTRRCTSTSFHHGVVISDQFMQEMLDGNKKNKELYKKILISRQETGEPYITYSGNFNKNLHEGYSVHGLKIESSNLCSEIFLPTTETETFVCCLSSLSLLHWDEWKDTDLVEVATAFLDSVITEFLVKARNIEAMEHSVSFAEKSRALGLGALGWHSLLQLKSIPFDSPEAMTLNNLVFKTIRERAEKASQQLAVEYGQPLWTQGCQVATRNLNYLAIAPNVSSAVIAGNLSQGIEPIIANYYAAKGAKGTYGRRNPLLEKRLDQLGKNTFETWTQINKDGGSVANLSFLSPEEKESFLTAREINQFAIIRQGSQRARRIDQGVSTNLFYQIPNDLSDITLRKKLAEYMWKTHIEAWEGGMKSLYYMKTGSVLAGGSVFKESSDCRACEG